MRSDARRRSEFLKKKLEVSTGDASSQSESVSEEEAIKEVVDKEFFKCEQCENIFKSENGLKIHVGKAHKKVNPIPSTPDQLRQQLVGSVSLSASPLFDTSREESNLNSTAMEENEVLTPTLQPPPSPPPPHKCPAFYPGSRKECKLRVEREGEKESLNTTCKNCDVKLYSSMCCTEEKKLCEYCCYDLIDCNRTRCVFSVTRRYRSDVRYRVTDRSY